MSKTDLSSFDNSTYRPGNRLVIFLWYFFNTLFMKNRLFPFMGIKKSILRMFGAKIGEGVVLKPAVNIKYPWKLEIGDHSWIGEEVWIDNLGKVTIGNNCCLSQGALLLCGNHDYKKPTFDLMVGDIHLADGVWIGARATVTGGVKCGSHSVLSVNSVTSSDLDEFTIYAGCPAIVVRKREIQSR